MDITIQASIGVYKEMRKEILARLKYASTLFLEVLIISIALLEVAFIHGPISLLLLFPGLLFYFLVLIWDQYIVVFSIGNYLRDNIEPELLKGSGLKGWEQYRHEKLSDKWIHLLALPYFIFPQIFLGLIALYLITLTEHSIYYLKDHLVVIWLLYASIMLLVSLFLYLFNKNQLKNNP